MSILLPLENHKYCNIVDRTPLATQNSAMPTMGEVLAKFRNEKQLTQQQVAEALDIDQETVSRFENLPEPPKRGNTYRRLVEFYGYTVEQANSLWRVSTLTSTERDELVKMYIDLPQLHMAAGLPPEEFVAQMAGLTTVEVKTLISQKVPFAASSIFQNKIRTIHATLKQLQENVADDPKPTERIGHNPYPKREVEEVDASRNEPQRIGHGIPLNSRVIAGSPTDYQKGIYTDHYLPSALVPKPSWKPTAYEVIGDSMSPQFREGDFILVGTRLRGIRDGDLAIFWFKDGRSTFKKLHIVSPDKWELVALNPYSLEPTRTYPREDIEDYAPYLGKWAPDYLRRSVSWDETG